MPDWCHCQLTVAGSAEELIRFRDGIKVGENTPYLEILASYYPVPKALYGIIEGMYRFEDGRQIHLWRESSRKADNPLELPVVEVSAEEKDTLLGRYGATNVLDWCETFWGTKWGDCHTELWEVEGNPGCPEALLYCFDAAWCCPCPGFLEVSKMFPLLTFSIDYVPETSGFADSFACRNGAEIFGHVEND